ncbi:MAG: hypothetical protein BGO70_12375 [Bacteroidetes bacterium 43-93]|nr:PorT family protein [Bacteroidota bacterium]OJW98252.1 MAG: hypothetical protein BGO70_12375 [Bacteroidetes bacterium 43-93]
MSKIRKFAGFVGAVVVFTSFSSTSRAQSYYVENENTFFGGPVVGANFAQVDGDNYAGYHKVGMNVGGIVYARFGESFAGSMEILYSQRGSRSNGAKGVVNVPGVSQINKYGIDLNYAEVPLMFHIFDKRRSHAGFGFSYSQLVSSKETVVTDVQKFNDTATFDRYPFKKYDVNFLIGGSLRLYKGLFLNVRFQYSLAPVRKDTYLGFARAQQFNNSWVVRIEYLFGDKYAKKND